MVLHLFGSFRNWAVAHPCKKKKICSQDARSLLAAENTKRWELVVVEGTKF